MDMKVKTAVLSVASNTVLILLKVIAGLISGSVSIISEAIHSGMDLIASIIAFFSVRVSSNPADADHPYGHGKVENVSGVVEGVLIFIAAGIIIVEAVKKMMHPAELNETGIAIGVMIFSAVVNSFVSAALYRVAKKEDSVALEADALHLKTDVYTSVGVGIGLLLMYITKIKSLDPIVAILVALLIIKESWHLTRNAFLPLLDTHLPPEELKKVRCILGCHIDEIIDYHSLRTRKSGNMRFVDVHITLPKDMTVGVSHALSNRIRDEMREALACATVTIHVDPDNKE